MISEDDERRAWFRREILPLEGMLRQQARRFCARSGMDADDLIHDTFSRLINYQGWRSVDHAPAFAIRTLRNLVLQAVRREKIVPIHMVADLETMPVADGAATADRIVEARDQLRLLAQLVGDLPPQCQRVFKMRKIDGLSNIDIADNLGLSVSTVEKHLIKALRICSEGLAQRSEYRGSTDAPWTRTSDSDGSRSSKKPQDGSSASAAKTTANRTGIGSRFGANKA